MKGMERYLAEAFGFHKRSTLRRDFHTALFHDARICPAEIAIVSNGGMRCSKEESNRFPDLAAVGFDNFFVPCTIFFFSSLRRW